MASKLRTWLGGERRAPQTTAKTTARRCALSVESLERRELLSTTLHLDLGTQTSPVASGYTGVPRVSYSDSRGFGWANTSGISAVVRSAGTALTRDMHVGTQGTFLAAVDQGAYDVTVTLGDPGARRDNVSIWAEGTLVASNVTTAAGQIAQRTFRVNVTDGKLTLRFVDGGGSNKKFAVNAIDVNPATSVSTLVASAGADKTANEGSSVSFAGAASGGTAPYSYSWSFGDGDSSSGANPSHTFADNGAYTVTLTVTDAAGTTSSDTAVVTVANVAPSGNHGGPYTGEPGEAVSFQATITDPSSVDAAAGFSYAWNFGDGATSTLAAPSHTYADAGTYTVSLTVKDKDNGAWNATTTAQISSGNVVTVHNASELQAAVNALQSGQTIVLAAGTYQLSGTLFLPQNRSDVTFRGATGNAADVIVRGNGMAGSVTFGFWLGNVQNATFADFTVRDLSQHGFILNAGVETPIFRNLRLVDIGDQFIKANPDGQGGGVDNGLVERCVLQYTTAAPDYYTNGVDVHAGDNWVIRNNTFKNFRLAGALAGPAILMWRGSQGTLTERNTFIDNHRDIAYGLDTTTATDHSGGIIRNNFILRSAGFSGDVGIGVFNSPNTQVLHNTVKLNGSYPNAVEYRFANTTGVVVRYNLTDAALVSRDGATASVSGNITNAQNAWFVNVAGGDLHLTATATAAINAAAALANVTNDYDGEARPNGAAPDVGADEYQGSSDNVAPSVALSAPANGATVSEAVTVSATASDNVGVVGVQFYLDGAPLGAEDLTSPFAVSWSTTTAANGDHTLTAKARDAAGNVATSAAVTVTVSNTSSSGGLLHQSDLQYVGAFKLPSGTFGASTFEYGGTALAFNPANNSLFLVGHDHQQAVAEIAIPNSIVNSGNLSNLATATVLQPFVNVLSKAPNNTLEGNVKVGGLMVVDGKLVGTAYEYYDADGDAVQSHFVLDSLNLSTANVSGLFRVGALGGGYVGGYMAPVPVEWQDELGAPYVTGQAALNIISRTSSGPALFGFDPAKLGAATAPATPYVYYPLSNPLGVIDQANPYFNGNTEIKGVVFPAGTRSVLFFGDHGIGAVGYGEAADFNDPYRGGKGWHSVNGNYAYQVWAYDVNDMIAVKNGEKQPWQIQPYEVWNFDLPLPDGAKHLGGTAFDPATGRLYVSQMHTGPNETPVIHVFQI